MGARMMRSVTLSLENVCVYRAGMGQNVNKVGQGQLLLRIFLVKIIIKTDRVHMSTINIKDISHKYSHQKGQGTFVKEDGVQGNYCKKNFS